MTHTPAPWNVTMGGAVQIGTSYFIDHMTDDSIEAILPEDAALISAAPDLLAALESLLKFAEQSAIRAIPLGAVTDSDLDESRSAIAKARRKG